MTKDEYLIAKLELIQRHKIERSNLDIAYAKSQQEMDGRTRRAALNWANRLLDTYVGNPRGTAIHVCERGDGTIELARAACAISNGRLLWNEERRAIILNYEQPPM